MPFTIAAFGEILWDLLPDGPVLGGATFNFSYRTSNLGIRTFLMSRLGRDARGHEAMGRMHALGMDTAFIQWDDALPTGTVPVRFDQDGSPHYTITQDVAFDAISFEPRMADLGAQADCLYFGTLIQRSPGSRATLQRVIDEFKGRLIVLDINLREGCWTPESIRSSIGRANVLKLNDAEVPVVADACGIHGIPLPAFPGQMLRRSSLSSVVVTLGSAGAYAEARSGERAYAPGYSVSVRDTVGAGDAFTAGFVQSLLESAGLREACAFGNRLGALVAAQTGASQSLAASKIREAAATLTTNPADPRFAAFL